VTKAISGKGKRGPLMSLLMGSILLTCQFNAEVCTRERLAIGVTL